MRRDKVLTKVNEDAAILFLRESLENGVSINRFSVGLRQSASPSSRAFVTYEGDDDEQGHWSCSKDGGVECLHIRVARKQLQKLLLGSPMVGEGESRTMMPGLLIRSIGKDHVRPFVNATLMFD